MKPVPAKWWGCSLERTVGLEKGLRSGEKLRSERASAARKQSVRAKAVASPEKAKAPVKEFGLSNGDCQMADLILNWKPKLKVDGADAEWEETGQIVRAIALKFNYQSEKKAREYLVALTRHTAILYRAEHITDDVEKLLSEESLAFTLGTSTEFGYSPKTKARDLSCLRRIRAHLLPENYAHSPELRYGIIGTSFPYREKELAEFLAVARSTSDQFHAAVILSLAAGLTGAEITNAKVEDLFYTSWGLVIKTEGLAFGGNRGPRVVPILGKHEEELYQIARSVKSGEFIGRSKKGELRDPSSLFPRRSELPIFKINRGRATWMRTLLENEVSFIAMRKAGVAVSQDGYLDDLVAGLEPAFGTYVRSVRGKGRRFTKESFRDLKEYRKDN